ncbi:uncharacterized protein [Macrobrachium rosenbergii]|uniref:uncharacterized protein n=1 Tax=Macrobrachium rosenbergii TaxID=79674 RepID=UPI0034D49253
MGNNSSSELSADEVATQVRHHYYYGAGAPNTFIRKVKTGHDHEAGAEEEVAGDATTPADSPQQCNPPPTPPPPTTEGNEQPGEDCHVIKEDVQASSRHDESSSPHSDPDPFAEDFPLDEDLMGSNNNEASRIGGGDLHSRGKNGGVELHITRRELVNINNFKAYPKGVRGSDQVINIQSGYNCVITALEAYVVLRDNPPPHVLTTSSCLNEEDGEGAI